jgi:hypothetical protein
MSSEVNECQTDEILQRIVESELWERPHHYMKLWAWIFLNAKQEEHNGNILNMLHVAPRQLEDTIRVEVGRGYRYLSRAQFKVALDWMSSQGIRDLLHQTYERVIDYTDGKDSGCIKTGIAALDQLTGGFAPGEFVTIATRPGCGKTTLAQAFSYNQAAQGIKVFFFQLEMTDLPQIGMRYPRGKRTPLPTRPGRFCLTRYHLLWCYYYTRERNNGHQRKGENI